ncbi:MAG: DnaB-like helicase N-terminal domain-containing protein, partial [Solimonas sp.]
MQNPPKHPPHSIEAEMSVLGGMMLDNRAGFEVLDVLKET